MHPADSNPINARDAGSGPDRASTSDWIAVIAAAIGALMATLDIAIVNTALPTITGEVGASIREGSWIATAYLVAEVIVIPLTGWFERLLGMRRMLLISASLFTAFSMVCGLADSLTMLIIGRIGQGFFGGAMIPAALTVIARRLPLAQRPLGTAIFGATIVMGPVLGPLLGGWIAESSSWRDAFWINVPIGSVLVMLLLWGIPAERGDWRALRDADAPGIVGMSIGLGCLTALLEQGHAEQWFESRQILQLATASSAGFLLLAVGQFRSRCPVIDLRLLKNRQFAAVFVISFALGAALYGTAFAIPQFLSLIAGDTPFQSGKVVFISGLPAIILIPFIPMLLRRVDLRWGIAMGVVAVAITCLLDAALSSSSGDNAFTASQLARGAGQVLAMTFLNQAAMNAVPVALAADASGLFNAARNLGGSVGLALLATLQESRLDLHRWNLASAVDTVHQIALPAQTGLSQADDGIGLAIIERAIDREALVMAFNDQFAVLAVALVAVLPLVLLLRRNAAATTIAALH